MHQAHIVFALLGSLTVASAAQGQTTVPSPKIVISNAAVEIPLQATSTVEVSASGDLSVLCALDSQGRCPSIGGDSGGTAPPQSFVLQPASVTTVQQGTNNVQLSWNANAEVADNAQVCRGELPLGISGWTGVIYPPSGSQALSLTAQDANTARDYEFQLRCYNAGGSRLASSAVITVTPPPPVSGFCGDYIDQVHGGLAPTDTRFTAYGYQQVLSSIPAIWGVPVGSGASAKPVTGTFLNPAAGRYLAIEFAMTADSGSTSQFILDWVENQGQGGVPSGAISISVSPCPGDFRATNFDTNDDPYDGFQCRLGPSATGNLTITSDPGLSGCFAPKDKIMYINVAPANMFGTSAPTQTNCGTSAYCGVSMTIR